MSENPTIRTIVEASPEDKAALSRELRRAEGVERAEQREAERQRLIAEARALAQEAEAELPSAEAAERAAREREEQARGALVAAQQEHAAASDGLRAATDALTFLRRQARQYAQQADELQERVV